MSSTLAMVLIAAMAVPGNGPEMVSGEMKQERLDLSGEWVGERRFGDGQIWQTELSKGEFKFKEGKELVSLLPVEFIKDEGNGRLRIDFPLIEVTILGLYKRENGRIIMCWGELRKERPSSFRAAKAESILILHRIKPGK
jgi:hypothetical protein